MDGFGADTCRLMELLQPSFSKDSKAAAWSEKCFGTKCKTFYAKWFGLPNKVLKKWVWWSLNYLRASFRGLLKIACCIDLKNTTCYSKTKAQKYEPCKTNVL